MTSRRFDLLSLSVYELIMIRSIGRDILCEGDEFEFLRLWEDDSTVMIHRALEYALDRAYRWTYDRKGDEDVG